MFTNEFFNVEHEISLTQPSVYLHVVEILIRNPRTVDANIRLQFGVGLMKKKSTCHTIFNGPKDDFSLRLLRIYPQQRHGRALQCHAFLCIFHPTDKVKSLARLQHYFT